MWTRNARIPTNSIKMNADFRSSTHSRNLQSRNSNIIKRPGSHLGCRASEFNYSSFETTRYQRRWSEEIFAPVYQSTRRSRSCDPKRSAFPTHYSRSQNMDNIQNREHRQSEKRSPKSCNSPAHGNNQNHSYCSRQSPRGDLKVSEWLPGCRLQNIEASGGKRDFRKWFRALPPNVLVDKDVWTDRGVFEKDNFLTSQALDNYLGIETNISPSNHQDYNLRSPWQ